jgi:hypothetical protein
MDDTYIFADGSTHTSLPGVPAEKTFGPTVAWSKAVQHGMVRHSHSFIEGCYGCVDFIGTVDADGLAEWRNCEEEEGWGASGVSIGANCHQRPAGASSPHSTAPQGHVIAGQSATCYGRVRVCWVVRVVR